MEVDKKERLSPDVRKTRRELREEEGEREGRKERRKSSGFTDRISRGEKAQQRVW
jgi:hypothetical protein